MAADIEREFGLASEFEGGRGGIFEVKLDGQVVFTNNRQGGVPSSDSVIEALRGRV